MCKTCNQAKFEVHQRGWVVERGFAWLNQSHTWPKAPGRIGSEAIQGEGHEQRGQGDGMDARGVAPPYSSSVTTTGTWSEGCSSARTSLSGAAEASRSASAGDSRAWSMRRPRSRCQAPAW